MKFNFEQLEVWQVSMELVEEVYKATRLLPVEEKYGLFSQMRRSAVSIPSNIAEGKSRSTSKDFRSFLIRARASACELQTQIIICERTKLLTSETLQNIKTLLDRVMRMLSSLISSLTVFINK